MEGLWLLVLSACGRMAGPGLDGLIADGCVTKAAGGECAGRSPASRGLKRSPLPVRQPLRPSGKPTVLPA